MLERLTPASIHPPFANYAHGVVVPAGARLVFVSGQVGIAADGRVPEDAEAQADLCLANVAAILAEAGAGPADVVRLNAFVTDRAHLAAYMHARDRFTAGHRPASTLMIVSGFARAELKVEVEAVAAVGAAP
jgi:enamine deaminase RidA (YjgF/YER057c/UK114 family)